MRGINEIYEFNQTNTHTKKNKNKQIGPWVQGTRLLVPFISLIPL